MSAQHVKIVANFKVNDYDGFLSFAKRCVDYCKTHEPDTLIYDWYLDADRENGRLLEVYTNSDAFRRHITGGVFTEIVPEFRKVIRWQSMETFGELPAEFDPVVKAVSGVHWAQPIAAL